MQVFFCTYMIWQHKCATQRNFNDHSSAGFIKKVNHDQRNFYSNKTLYFHHMKKFVLLLALYIVCEKSSAQFTMRIIVNDMATKKNDDIYVAGDFNNWNPHDDARKMKLFGATRRIYVL